MSGMAQDMLFGMFFFFLKLIYYSIYTWFYFRLYYGNAQQWDITWCNVTWKMRLELFPPCMFLFILLELIKLTNPFVFSMLNMTTTMNGRGTGMMYILTRQKIANIVKWWRITRDDNYDAGNKTMTTWKRIKKSVSLNFINSLSVVVKSLYY